MARLSDKFAAQMLEKDKEVAELKSRYKNDEARVLAEFERIRKHYGQRGS